VPASGSEGGNRAAKLVIVLLRRDCMYGWGVDERKWEWLARGVLGKGRASSGRLGPRAKLKDRQGG
jgi:hypothetical protein